jgi:hypothetical protein
MDHTEITDYGPFELAAKERRDRQDINRQRGQLYFNRDWTLIYANNMINLLYTIIM